MNSKNTVNNILNWLKIPVLVHNNAFSSDKVILSESEEKYGQIKHCLYKKTVLSKYVGAIIMDYGILNRWQWFKIIIP